MEFDEQPIFIVLTICNITLNNSSQLWESWGKKIESTIESMKFNLLYGLIILTQSNDCKKLQ